VTCGEFASITEAQAVLCPPFREILPDARSVATYEQLYPMYRELYFALGSPDASPLSVGRVLPTLRSIAAQVRTT
jgi:L-ribulokinase